MGFLSWQAQVMIVGGGLFYLVYAKKKGMFPFNKGGIFDTLGDLTSSSDDSGNSSNGDSSNSGPSSSSLGPAGNSFQLGNGFSMNVPPGGVNTPLVLSPAQQATMNRQFPFGGGTMGVSGGQVSGPPNPFVSTVANDPTPTDYGVYTQYLQGMRNEYQNMQNAIAAQQGMQTGIGGDITTLPQPPQVGAVPYGSNGFGPPMFPGVGVPPPPIPYGFPFPRQPPIFLLPPPRRGWRRFKHRRSGYIIDISPNGGINLPGINIGANGIDIAGLVKIGGGQNGLFGDLLGGIFGGGGGGGNGGDSPLIDVGNGTVTVGSGGINVGNSNSNNSSDGFGGFLGGLLNNMDLSRLPTGSGTNNNTKITFNGQDMTPSELQQTLQQQIQDQVKNNLSASGLTTSFATTTAVTTTDPQQQLVTGQLQAQIKNIQNQMKLLAQKKKIKGLTRAEYQHQQNLLKQQLLKLRQLAATQEATKNKHLSTTTISPTQVPADVNSINPTLMNLVSRNQPFGLMQNKLGNI